MLKRLPIRARLTVVFVVTMAGVIAAVGAFLFFWTRHSIDASIEQSLRARQGAAAALLHERRGAHFTLPPGERYAQVVSATGQVLASQPERAASVLSPAQVRASLHGLRRFELHERARYIAGPVQADGRRVVVVAAASLADHERALEGLSGALLIGAPLALLLAAAGAYWLAGRALRPVEEMRARAATISTAHADARLPVPEVDDEVRRLSLTLNEMLQRMSASAEHERRFVANASHELRTPLAALRTELELAERHAGTVGDYREAILRSRSDVERLIRLSDDLLALARADEAAPRTADVDLDAVLAEAVAPLRVRAADAGRALDVEPAAAGAVGDHDALMRAVRNLVENALVHGSGAIRVGASVPPDAPGYVELWVEDDGTLHPSARGSRAFERFARGADAAERPGSGLGLALVDAIARQHGGAADLSESQAGGVRASVRIARWPTRTDGTARA